MFLCVQLHIPYVIETIAFEFTEKQEEVCFDMYPDMATCCFGFVSVALW